MKMTLKEMEPGHFCKLPYGSGAGLNSGEIQAEACGPVFIESNIDREKCKKERS